MSEKFKPEEFAPPPPPSPPEVVNKAAGLVGEVLDIPVDAASSLISALKDIVNTIRKGPLPER